MHHTFTKPPSSRPKYAPVLILFFTVLAVLMFSARVTESQAAAAPATESGAVLQTGQVITDTVPIYLPLLSYNWPPTAPAAVKLNPIQNMDGDNAYTVAWNGVANASRYVLEVSSTKEFTNPAVAYEGPNTSLSYSQGQTPGAYFYRVKAANAGGDTPWSEVQSITIYPLHVGLAFRWDGTGKISGDSLITVGTHETVRFDKMTDGDTIEMSGRFWYDPNPIGWEEETYTGSYSVSTGNYRSTGESSDSILKWGYDWKLPYWSGFTDGQTIQIYGQPFTVHGPIWGQTPVGNIAYWEMKNQADFVLLDYGDGFVEIVHSGNATLRYETGPYGMLVYDDIRRSIYYQGVYTEWWVQYISQLTSRTTSPVAYQTAGLPLPQPAPRENEGPFDNLFFRPPLLQR